MKKFGKNKIYLDNLLGFKQDYKKESKISELRDSFNNKVREKGNNLYKGLGDLMTMEVAKKGREEILFLSFFVPAVFLNSFGYFYDMENRIQKEIHKPKVLYKNSIENLSREKGRALILQQEYSRNDDVEIMVDELRKRNFTVELIEPENATKENLVDKIGKIAEKSGDSSKTLVYFAAHGGIREKRYNLIQQGVCLNSNKDDSVALLTPHEFYNEIKKVKGKKAVIVDSCFSGSFTEYLKPLINDNTKQIYKGFKKPVENLENYLVIASCPELTVSKISNQYIDGKIISSLMSRLYPLLSSNKEKINLSKEEVGCGDDLDRINLTLFNRERLIEDNYPLSYDIQRVFDTDFILPERFDKVDDFFFYNSL
jgi:hypothetical protein